MYYLSFWSPIFIWVLYYRRKSHFFWYIHPGARCHFTGLLWWISYWKAWVRLSSGIVGRFCFEAGMIWMEKIEKRAACLASTLPSHCHYLRNFYLFATCITHKICSKNSPRFHSFVSDHQRSLDIWLLQYRALSEKIRRH